MIDWRAFWVTYLLLACALLAIFIPQQRPVPTVPPHQPPTPTIVMEHR
jgi:hypothetical protein